jgi:dUTP pyrophosphatase
MPGLERIILKFKRVHKSAIVPRKYSENAAGFDIHTPEAFEIEPDSRKLIKTGIKVEIPHGYVGFIKPRSGLGLKGIDAFEGVIDSDYRGEVGVIMINKTKERVAFNDGFRIAQLVILPIPEIEVKEVEDSEDLTQTERGEGGFGSTNKN